MRRPTALLLAALVAAAGVLAPVPAVAAEGPRVLVQREDPLRADPVVLRVTALDASGAVVRFSGTATLATGKVSVAAPVAAADDRTALVRIPTGRLRAGWATLRLRVRVAGRTVSREAPYFAELPATLSVRGFGCAGVTAAGGTIRWAVDRLHGEPIRTPNSRDVPLLPYVRSSGARWVMTGEDGLPLSTSGTVVVRSAAGAVVARQRLAKQVRRLVFGAPWTGRVGGAFRPGSYTARLTLTDATGRTVVAEQAVTAAAASPCGT